MLSADSYPVHLVFHKVLDRFTYGVTNYSPDRLTALLDQLTRSGYRLDGTGAGGEACGPNIMVTFDDGYEHLRKVIPDLIDRYRLTPVVFMPTAWIGQRNRWDYSYRVCPCPHLDRESIRFLADLGVEFGSHGHRHTDLTALTPSDLRAELYDSRRRLEDLTGRPVSRISYPFGRFSERVIEATSESGYECGYTMRLPAADDQSLSTGRVPVYAFDTPLAVRLKLSGTAWRGLEKLKALTVNRLSGGTVWLNRLRSSSLT